MRTLMWRFKVRDALVAVAILGLIAAGARRLLRSPPLPHLTEGARLEIPTQATSVTMVGFDPKSPPPWSAGNCFALSPLAPANRAGGHHVLEYHVANMHWENFEEVVRRLDLKRVEVEHIGGCFLVVDPRIPRRWRRERPCPACTPASVRDALLTKHADRFREQGAQQ
jgi:hypothetical protein